MWQARLARWTGPRGVGSVIGWVLEWTRNENGTPVAIVELAGGLVDIVPADKLVFVNPTIPSVEPYAPKED